jgi:prepilin-type N-terminal cleavage/methylation domain-containing protein
MMGPVAVSRFRKPAEGGFSLLEVLISMVILTVGLVSLLSVFGLAMASTQSSQQDMIAKELANEALESIVTARNTSQMTWDDIQNTGSSNCGVTGITPCGIFATGAQPIYLATTTGTHAGIVGTTDDIGQPEQTLEEPGADGKYGDTDDVILPLTNFKRTVLISQVVDVNNNSVPSLRSVNITMQYTTASNLQKSYVLNSFISQYR